MWSNEEGIDTLTPFGTEIDSPVTQAKMLTLALEPECAAIAYCTYEACNDNITTYSDTFENPDKTTKCYLILDIGGGTVDITILRHVSPNRYDIAIPPLGNASGGLKVNAEFEKFLEEVVEDKGFSKFKREKLLWIEKERDDHCAALARIINYDFEKVKTMFGVYAKYPVERDTEPSLLELENKFLQFYKQKKIEKKINKKGDSKMRLKGSVIEIEPSKMVEFFEPALNGIKEIVLEALKQAPIDQLDAVYIAGGFGGCQYVVQFLKTVIHTIKKLPILVPKDYTLAVSQGAALYCRQPDVVTARMMDATYGIAISIPFVEGEHKEEYASLDDTGIKFCDHIFQKFVTQGDSVKFNDVLTEEVFPFRHAQESVQIDFYRSKNPDAYYVTDKGTENIGELTLEIENPDNLPVRQRTLRVTMNFSLTEITANAQALYLPGRPPVNTKLDFLTK